ncbi:XRE family transcriptional regulator [Wenjunlia vitaminophila]|uniref:XRE family transcriptional regulator n=1 Tax=Wenjunlia vitaminophila TaxID=76728 RepID=A0A0T6LR41_WENVI|nr:helix-turn-helix transcriptional regulator [Wenjunlia vitaminophila]KRV48517.1 XRE family transcriptional regulator [Wenjunlia vitaminophila]
MGLRANPSQRQRRLGAELRRLRELSGLSATEAGAFAGLGRAHMSHIEMGRTAIPEEKLRALARAYGCRNTALVDALVAMGQATGRGWWSRYREPFDSAVRDLAELESTARRVRTFQWLYVPGLLQTRAYMHAVFRGAQPDAAQALVDSYVEFRERRSTLLTGEDPPRFHAVIHEAAFSAQFVGPSVMRAQIEHLLELSRLPHVQIQVLPFRTQTYPVGFSAPFVLLDGPVPELDTVFLEHPAPSQFLTDPARLNQYSDAFARLDAVALPPVDPQNAVDFHTRRDSFGFMQHLLYRI